MIPTFFMSKSISVIEMDVAHDYVLIQSWLKRNGLQLNTHKTEFILFTKPGYTVVDRPLILQDVSLPRSGVVRYLGVLLDQHLNWEAQTQLVINNVLPPIAAIYRLRKTLDRNRLLSIYYALVHVHLFHLSSVWGRCRGSLLKAVTKIQAKCLKYILCLPIRTPTKLVFEKTKVMPLTVMIELSSACIIYKALLSNYVGNIRLKTNVIHQNRIIKPHCSSTKYGLNGVLCKAIDAYNCLPSSIRGVAEYTLFRKRALGYFLNTFYCKLQDDEQSDCI